MSQVSGDVQFEPDKSAGGHWLQEEQAGLRKENFITKDLANERPDRKKALSL